MTQQHWSSRAGAMFESSPVYERTEANGRVVTTRIDKHGRINTYDNGIRLGDARAIRFNPVLDRTGSRLAYVEGDFNQGRGEIVVDGRSLGDARSLDHKPVFDDTSRLFWLRQSFTKGRDRILTSQLCYESRKGSEVAECQPLDFFANGLRQWAGNIAITGRNSDSGKYLLVLAEFDDSGEVALRTLIEQDKSLVCHRGQVFAIEGEGSLSTAFYGYLALVGPQRHEPFAYGSNGLGRLTWNTSNRINLAAHLYSVTQDPLLADYLDHLCQRLLKRSSHRGRYLAWKYSEERERRLSWIVLDGMIYAAMFEAWDALSEDTRMRLLQKSEAAFEDMERFWDADEGAYLWPVQSQRKRDGILPFNQQNALGRAMLGYMRATDSQIYEARVKDLYDSLAAEIVELPDGNAWRYWPLAHYEKRQTAPVDRWEDSGHASINAEFMRDAAAFLGNDLPFSPAELAARLRKGPLSFSRSMAGDSIYKPSLYWQPTHVWAEYEPIKKLYETWHGIPRADFDLQHIHSGYGRALKGVEQIEGAVKITPIRPRASRNGFISGREITIMVSDGQTSLDRGRGGKTVSLDFALWSTLLKMDKHAPDS